MRFQLRHRRTYPLRTGGARPWTNLAPEHGGPRLVTGNMTPHMQLESALAAFKGSESALAFTSGYTANMGVISALCHKDTVIFSDALNHASIIDGCRLARARTVVYAHNDMEDLREKIRQLRLRHGFRITNG